MIFYISASLVESTDSTVFVPVNFVAPASGGTAGHAAPKDVLECKYSFV